ncbi:hypothetical protein LHP98_19225, partial [Rhodobacter sp. Har01]|uniref:hypothetical protein n=1 Tax=Rhodobacter sp. Har01 TaxID=2883999 RepID=UPI001D0941E0
MSQHPVPLANSPIALLHAQCNPEPRDFQVNTSLTDLDNPVVDQRGASEMNSLIAAVFLLPVTVL